jgi:hypothetical protein
MTRPGCRPTIERGWIGQQQEQALWCWAAMLAVVSTHRNVHLRQCDIASAVKDGFHRRCCSGTVSACFDAASDGDVLGQLALLGVTATAFQPVASEVQDTLAKEQVVWLAVGTKDGDHYILVEGYDPQADMYHVLDGMVVSASDVGASRSSRQDLLSCANRAWALAPRDGCWHAQTPTRPVSGTGSDQISCIVESLLAERNEAFVSVEVTATGLVWEERLQGREFDLHLLLMNGHRHAYGLTTDDGCWHRVVCGAVPQRLVEDARRATARLTGEAPGGRLTWSLAHQTLFASAGPLALLDAASPVVVYARAHAAARDARVIDGVPGWCAMEQTAGEARTRLEAFPAWGGRFRTDGRRPYLTPISRSALRW